MAQLGFKPWLCLSHRLREGPRAGHCSTGVGATPAPGCAIPHSGDSQLVAETVPPGQPGGASHALPTGPPGQPLQAHGGYFRVFPIAPQPHHCTLLLWPPQRPLTASLARVGFEPFPGLVLLCPPSWTVLWRAVCEAPWTIRLLRGLHSPRPWVPLSHQDPQPEHRQSAALFLSPAGKAAQGPGRGDEAPPPWCILPGWCLQLSLVFRICL